VIYQLAATNLQLYAVATYVGLGQHFKLTIAVEIPKSNHAYA